MEEEKYIDIDMNEEEEQECENFKPVDDVVANKKEGLGAKIKRGIKEHPKVVFGALGVVLGVAGKALFDALTNNTKSDGTPQLTTSKDDTDDWSTDDQADDDEKDIFDETEE